MTIKDNEMYILILVGKTVRETERRREQMESTEDFKESLVLLQEQRELLTKKLEELSTVDSDEPRIARMIDQVSERFNDAIERVDLTIEELVYTATDELGGRNHVEKYRFRRN